MKKQNYSLGPCDTFFEGYYVPDLRLNTTVNMSGKNRLYRLRVFQPMPVKVICGEGFFVVLVPNLRIKIYALAHLVW